MRVTIQINRAVVAAGVLWLAAAALMAWDFLDGPHVNEKGRWALLVGIAASTTTLALVMRHCRRVILEVMSREHLMQMMGSDEEEQRSRASVRALR